MDTTKYLKKRISFFKVYYGSLYSHSKNTNYKSYYSIHSNDNNNINSLISSFGIVKIHISGKGLCVYSGYLIASNIFLTVLKNSENEEIHAEMLSFKKNHVCFSKEKKIQIKKGKRIDDDLVILILEEEIGDEIGYIGISDDNGTNPLVSLSYNKDDDKLYKNKNSKECFIFNYINGSFYLTKIGSKQIITEFILQINTIYIKNLKYFHLVGLSLTNNKTILKRLKNYNFPILEYASIAKLDPYMKSVNHFINLNEIVIHNCPIYYDNLQLNRVYLKHKYIRHLDISYNQLGPTGMQLLSEISFESLVYLNISYNQIRKNGIEFLSKMSLDCLEYLNISGNELRDEGISILSLMSLKKVQYLNITANEIGDEGIKSLSLMLLDSLINLNLSNNHIGPNGIEILSQMSLDSLEYLNITNNKLGEKGRELLSNMNYINKYY